MDVTFHVQFSSLIQTIQNNCAIGTKKNFKDRTIVLQALVQDGGAIIFVRLNSALSQKGFSLDYLVLFRVRR